MEISPYDSSYVYAIDGDVFERIRATLDARIAHEQNFHGKSDDLHGEFAQWLLEAFDKRYDTPSGAT